MRRFGKPDTVPVLVEEGGVTLQGDLTIPSDAGGLVVFAHGSGSSRYSLRNQYVARALREAGMGTLLLDLLTPEEEHDRANVFDIALLADRLVAAVTWLRGHATTVELPLGLFGASTGAGAALWAAADAGLGIDAVVSRGGRPDLAGERLAAVTAPTLLIVGGADTAVLQMNRRAQTRLGGPSRMAVIPGAGHLFEEPGALDQVAALAAEWFRQKFTAQHGQGDAAAKATG